MKHWRKTSCRAVVHENKLVVHVNKLVVYELPVVYHTFEAQTDCAAGKDTALWIVNLPRRVY